MNIIQKIFLIYLVYKINYFIFAIEKAANWV